MKVLRCYLPLVLAISLLFTNSSISAMLPTSRRFSWSSAITGILSKALYGNDQKNNLDNTDTSSDGQSLDDIEQFCDNEKYLSGKKVSIGESIVDGREYKLTEDITVKQVLVLNQNQRDEEGIYTGGGEDSCAYHTVKNASLIAQAISEHVPNLSTCLQGDKYSRDRFAIVEETNIGRWRSDVIDWRDTSKVKKNFAQKINSMIDYTCERKNRGISLRLKKIADDIAETLARGLVQNVTKKFKLTPDRIKVFVNGRLGSTKLDKEIRDFIVNGCIQFGKELKQIDLSNSILVTDTKKEIKKDKIKSDFIKLKGESLDRDEITKLVKKLKETGKWPERVTFSVIEDVKILDRPKEFLDEQDRKMINYLDVVKQRLHKDQPFMHVFFISTSGHMESGKEKRLQGTYGHWLSLVYSLQENSLQEKKRVCVVADSKNIIRLYKDPCVKKIIEELEGKEVAQNCKLTNKNELKLMKTGINRLIEGHDKTPPENRDRDKKYLSTLNDHYHTWSDMKLPDKTIKKIEDIFID